MSKKTITTVEDMIEILEHLFPKEKFQPSELFDGTPGGIWCGAEPGPIMEDDRPAFNYYTEDYKEVVYVMMVHKKMIELLKFHGYFAEFQDAGTVMLFPS